MSSRRVPLANNPNAANSPFRLPALSKRTRAQASEQKDLENTYSPPKKKQLIGIDGNGTRRAQHISPDEREGRVFLGKADAAATNAFNRKLAAVREPRQSRQRPTQKSAERETRTTNADQEMVRQWRKHYKKVFPEFVFYFESLPGDVVMRSAKQIYNLGAREEKFFSKDVTHIVTARVIPPSPEMDSANGHGMSRSQTQSGQKTINPSLLERGTDALAHVLQRGRHVADLNGQKSRQQAGSADVLQRARELGIKIWALEKFERMMNAMFEESDDEDEHTNHRKTTHVSRGQEKDLSQLLRHEKEKTAAVPQWSEIVPFRGYYIYIHDMDERTKPVMVREYNTVRHKEEGEWPQFRSVTLPRCPFVEDPAASKREAREEEKRLREKEAQAQLTKAQRQQPRTRAAAATIARASVEPAAPTVLGDNHQAVNRTANHVSVAVPVKGFEPPAVKPNGTNTSLDSMLPHMTSTRLGAHVRPGLEPMASGLQQANVTSAIRSQMISSTAACPTIRAGTSKEMHQQLQRRAVERRTNLSTTSAPSATEVRAAINTEQAAATRRTTRRKPELTRIHEDATLSEDEGSRKQAPQIKEKQAVARDPKPGYCENCRDKYDDFGEHIESRKHKKFALTGENWTELDDLLQKLVRR